MTGPRVVALMAARNAREFIVPVLESLAAQDHPNLEVLISDDASIDDTAAICERFAATHRNFRVIRQSRRRGWVGNVNALLRAAQGDYFFFAAHDDLVRPTYVSRLVDALEGNPQAVLAFTDMIQTHREPDGTLRDGGVHSFVDLEGVSDQTARGLVAARPRTSCYGITVAYRGLFRSEAARRIGGLRRHMAGEFGADWPWLLHMALLGEFIRVPEPLIEKYAWSTTLSATWRYSPLQRLGLFQACMRETLRAPLSWDQKARICAEVVRHPLKMRWWSLHARIRDQRRRLSRFVGRLGSNR